MIASAALVGPTPWSITGPLSIPLARWLGARSYSWYLWHWPALSLLAIALADDNPHGAWRMAAVLLSLLAAMATYHFVETPIRNGSFVREN